jgi:hypothetical protein
LLGTTDVYSDTLAVEGATPVVVYCLDSTLVYDATTQSVYTAGLQSSASITDIAQAADLAANSAQIATPLADANAEAVAIQLAIWHLTGGLDFSTVPNANIVARANALVAAAQPLAQGLTGGVLTAASTQSGSTDSVTATLIDPQGNPLVNQNIVFAGPSGPQTVATDSSGAATVSFAAAAGTETATWNGQLPPGTVFFPPGATQRVVAASAVPITRSATATTADAATTTTTTPATTTPTTTPTPTTAPVTPTTTPASPTTAPAAQLPYTGTWVKPYYLVLAALLAAVGIFVRRRLRARP